MEIGISSACFYPDTTENSFYFLASNEIKNTEIFFNSFCELEDKFIDELVSVKDYYGVEVNAIHPFSSAMEPYLLFAEYPRRFEDARPFYNQYFKVAKKLGAKVVSLHGDRPDRSLSVEEYASRYKILYNDAKNEGVILTQENVAGFKSRDVEFLAELKEILNGEIAFTLDIKQCIRSGHEVMEVAKVMGENIAHVHLSDHSAISDCLLPGKGIFNYGELFGFLKNINYNGKLMIEVYKDAYKDPNEVIAAYENLRRML